ncbi:MAG: hypothetical protein IGBAC_0463 [Ignavibacteriae bacterium]|nr:MAG: hypothetical protein IGBAC_0463 [Ignavibacteriota bacterium]
MNHKLLLCILGVVSCLSTASGQESQTKIGVGVSLNPTALLSTSTSSTLFLPVGLTNIYIPIMVSANFRIEPEAGIYSLSSETSSGSSTRKSSLSILRLAIGLFYVLPAESSFNSYFGPRVGILSTSSTSSFTGSTEAKTSETDFFIGFCVGGEYLFSPHFSAGGEAQLNYISFGNPDRSVFTNNALMFFRWYF